MCVLSEMLDVGGGGISGTAIRVNQESAYQSIAPEKRRVRQDGRVKESGGERNRMWCK